MTFSVTKDIFITRISQQTASRVVTMVTTGRDNRRIVVTIRWKSLVMIKS